MNKVHRVLKGEFSIFLITFFFIFMSFLDNGQFGMGISDWQLRIRRVSSSCSIKVHSFKNPWLTRWPLKRTSKDHLPLGYSAQGWVVIKGHLVNPSRESSSLGLLLKMRER